MAIALCVILLLVIIFLIIVRKNKNKDKISKEFPGLLEALGGRENISNIVLNGSRIGLNFENKKIINKEVIKENGVETIVVSNKKITLVVGKKAPVIYRDLQNNKKEA